LEKILGWRQFLRFENLPKVSLVGMFFVLVFGIKLLTFNNTSISTARSKHYRFRINSQGFLISDLNHLNQMSQEEAEDYLAKSFPQNMQSKVHKLIRPILFLCEKYQVDPYWVLSVLWTESNFKADAVSNKGANGLMQIMPITALEFEMKLKSMGNKLEASRDSEYLQENFRAAFESFGHAKLTKKLKNIELGIFYLKNLLEQFDNNHMLATVSYNMGPSWTRVRVRGGMKGMDDHNYLKKVVKAYYHITRNISGNQTLVSFTASTNEYEN
jgi:hypothetical protein